MTPWIEDKAMDNVQSENDDVVIDLSNPTVQLSDYSSPSLMIPQLEGETTLDKIEDKPDTQTSSFKEGKSAAWDERRDLEERSRKLREEERNRRRREDDEERGRKYREKMRQRDRDIRGWYT